LRVDDVMEEGEEREKFEREWEKKEREEGDKEEKRTEKGSQRWTGLVEGVRSEEGRLGDRLVYPVKLNGVKAWGAYDNGADLGMMDEGVAEEVEMERT
jgi:hypothetical protein